MNTETSWQQSKYLQSFNFDPCNILRTFQGLGTNEAILIEILASRTPEVRVKARRASDDYKHFI